MLDALLGFVQADLIWTALVPTMDLMWTALKADLIWTAFM